MTEALKKTLEPGEFTLPPNLHEPMKGRVVSLKDVHGRIRILKGYASKMIQPEGAQFAVIMPRIEPGDVKQPHRHTKSDSCFVLLEGEGEFLYCERGSKEVKSFPVKQGDLWYSLAGEGHGIRNTGTVSLKYLCVEGPLPMETEFVIPMEQGDMAVVD